MSEHTISTQQNPASESPEFTKLIHYGLQRSGTNYLTALLQRKYKVQFINDDKHRDSPFHKHFRLYNEKKIIPESQYYNELYFHNFDDFTAALNHIPEYCLVISKDPYSWFLSYVNWAKKNSWPEVPHHYIEEYNLFYGKWLEFSQQSDRILFVRYLDLLSNPKNELRKLNKIMKLNRMFRQLFLPARFSKIPHSPKFTSNRRKYYLQKQYLKDLHEGDLREINDHLDAEVCHGLGYEVEAE